MRRWGIAWGVLLVLLGGLLLANEAGLLAVPVWSLIWPLALVFLGIWLVVSAFMRPAPGRMLPLSVPLAGAPAARVVVKHGAGRLDIAGGAAPGNAVDGEGVGLAHREVRDARGLYAELTVSDRGPWDWGEAGLDWRLRLTEAVPLALEMYVGASENHVDLTRVRCTELRFETGASSTQVALPASAGMTDVQVRTGAASVRLFVPEGVEARITGTTGLASIDVDARRFPRTADGWESPGYAGAPNRVSIHAEVGVGTVQVS